MVNHKNRGANAHCIKYFIMMMAILFLTGSAYAETILWDESQGSPLPFTWNNTNFDGFNVGGIGTEDLTVWQTDLNSIQRNIDKGNLTYSTTPKAKKLNAVIALNLTSNQEMTDKGLEQAAPGRPFDNGEYYIINWQAERYVAIYGKANKLARLIIEQELTEKKTLMTGETWDIGGGWELYVNAIDAKATPKQVWISLYKNGIKKDDKVVTAGTNDSRPIYTYVEKSYAGELDVPVFVTYVDNIFAGESSDMVTFGGTWALSSDVNIIQSGNIYGILKVVMAGSYSLLLRNVDTPVTLFPNATIDLMGNIKFKVIDDTNYLKFSPSDGHGGTYSGNAIWDESQGSPLPFTWNITNFDGFNVGGVGTENLTVWQTDLNSAQRTIAAGNLSYSTTAQAKKLNVVIALNLTDNQAMTNKGLEQAAPGKAFDNGEYYILNWQAERYVAVNRKVNKLARLVMEQGISEKKSMMVGETWDIGDGWALYVNSVDANAMPRQAWISLYKNGIKKDDKVISAGTSDARPIFTYVEKSFAGETDVPLFVTYASGIFAGENSYIVQFGGTWALSTDVNVIQSGSSYGIFRDAMVGFNKLTLKNTDTSVTLSPNSTINLIGNIKFKVINDATYLKFYPSDEPVLDISAFPDRIPAGTPTNVVFTVTSGGSSAGGAVVSLSGAANLSGLTDMNGQINMSITAAYEGNITAEARKAGYTTGTTTVFAYGLSSSALDSWILEENYVLNLIGIDPRSSPKQARLQLSRDGILVKDIIAEQGSMFEYCPGNCIFNATVDVIFNGTQGVAVMIGNASQYSEINGMPVMTDAVHLFRSAIFTGISWLIDEGYDLKMMDIDHRSYPRLVWFEMLKNGTVMDDAFLSTDERYTYISPSNSTILTAFVDAIFKGDANSVVKLTEVYQYSEKSDEMLLDNASHSYISGATTRTDQPLYEGYNLSVLGIDAYGYPRQTWIRLYKNDMIVDDKILAHGEIYRYDNSSGIILYAEISDIFSGHPLSAVKFRNVTQYSEIDGSILINGATYTIALYGTPVPVPIPSVTLPSLLGTYEIRGTPASEAATWTPQNFAGFFYDINSNTGNEKLNILQPDLAATRTIDNGNLTYTTTAQTKMLNVVKYAFSGNVPAAEASGLAGFDNGNYYIMGWQGERYTALKGRVDKLAGLVLEQGATAADKKTLAMGETWDIGGNWTLTVQSIDVKAYPRQAWLTLGRDGAKVEDIFVSQRNIYTFVDKSFSNETDVPLFMTYLDTVFAGATTDMVQLRYTWALNTTVKEIMYNETYGIFTDAEVSLDKTLKLKNSNNTISLTRGSTIDLMGPLRFRVADNDSLRFMPVAVYRQAGIVDIRGAVWNETPIEGFGGIGRTGVWNASNFAGFFHDIDNDLGKEELNVLQTDLYNYQRTIYQNNLVYTTSAQPKMLNLVKYAFGGNVSAAAAAGLNMTAHGQAFEGGSYQIIGWQGEKHVAVNGMVIRLSDLILEQGTSPKEKKTMLPNETWSVGGGWTLTLDFADAKASPRQVGITLRKDGEFRDSKVLTSGPFSTNSVYTYADPITGVPLFVTYVDSIFAGAYSDMAQFRYTWAVSPEVTSINSGDRFGVFNVTEVDTTAKRIGLRNIDTAVILTQYSGTVDLMGELKFRVANDDSVLRFSPFKRVTTPYDSTPPGSIFGLRNISYAQDYITWMWLIPADADFDHTQVYFDGDLTENQGQSRSFTASGLAPDTEHTISTHTVDTSGNINTTWVNHTAKTAPLADTTPPGSVNDLRASIISKRYIVWRWTDPQDADFNKVIVYLDGRFMTNVTKGTGSYTAINLKPNSVHTISTRTVDITGNINQTWVNNTART